MNFKKSVELAEFYILNEAQQPKKAKVNKEEEEKDEDNEHKKYLAEQLPNKSNFTDSKGKAITKEKIISEILKEKKVIKNNNKYKNVKENIGIITHDLEFFKIDELKDNQKYNVTQIITYNQEMPKTKNDTTKKSDIIVTSVNRKKLPSATPQEKNKTEIREVDISKLGKNYPLGEVIKKHEIDTRAFYTKKNN